MNKLLLFIFSYGMSYWIRICVYVYSIVVDVY